MRYTFIILSLLLLANCRGTYPSETPEGKAKTQAYLLCGSMTNDCYQRSYPTFYQTEVQAQSQAQAEHRARMDAAWQSIQQNAPTNTPADGQNVPVVDGVKRTTETRP